MKRIANAGVVAPLGFKVAAGKAGIKPGALDVALVVCDTPATCAGVFTLNRVKAAPVVWSQRIVRGRKPVRAVLINSGNANACTGDAGFEALSQTVASVSEALECSRREVLVMSTGVIGVPLPVDGMVAEIPRLAKKVSRSRPAEKAVACSMMTTDTRPKSCAVQVEVASKTYTVGGMAKGSGMIHPNMATMLGVITTDAPLEAGQAQALLKRAVDVTFNAITVDGDTSTNDSVFLLCSGEAGGRVPEGSAAEAVVYEAIEAVCRHLAEAIAADGEGVTKVIELTVSGAKNVKQARQVAQTVATSLLVKTAVHGGDPNWGRVLAAAGRSGVAVDVRKMGLMIGDHLVAYCGGARPEGEKGAAQHLRGKRVRMELQLGQGAASARVLSGDLSAEYVRVNAHYRT